MYRLTHLKAREVLDSRGRPTVEVEAASGRFVGRAIVPSGASTGRWEACELRDGDPARYDGRGVTRAVQHVQQVLAPLLLRSDVTEQTRIDELLIAADGTERKTNLGANALLGVSLAIVHLGAALRGLPLYRHFQSLFALLPPLPDSPCPVPTSPRMPLPMTNMISGGLHAGGNLDFQFMGRVSAGKYGSIVPSKKRKSPVAPL